jgi:hypothetical protein
MRAFCKRHPPTKSYDNSATDAASLILAKESKTVVDFTVPESLKGPKKQALRFAPNPGNPTQHLPYTGIRSTILPTESIHRSYCTMHYNALHYTNAEECWGPKRKAGRLMKEPNGSEKQGKTKSKRGGKKHGVTDSWCKDSSTVISRIDEAAGTDDVDASGTECVALSAHSDEEDESTRKKSRSEES